MRKREIETKSEEQAKSGKQKPCCQKHRLLVIFSLFTLVGGLSITIEVSADPVVNKDNADRSSNFGGRDIESKTMDRRDHRERDRDRDLDSDDAYLETSPNLNSTNNSPNGKDRNDAFDGSEFKASPFDGSQFDKETFSKLFGPSPSIGQADKSDSTGKDDGKDMLRGSTDKPAIAAADRRRKLREAMDRDDYRNFIKPVYYLPGAWVPSAEDPTWNGGFVVPPDNGSPVPYRLNGHVDLQRDLPWKSD